MAAQACSADSPALTHERFDGRLRATPSRVIAVSFRKGRRAVIADTDRCGRASAGYATPSPSSQAVRRSPDGVRAGLELGGLLEVRIPELIAYQDKAYAQRYVRFVE